MSWRALPAVLLVPLLVVALVVSSSACGTLATVVVDPPGRKSGERVPPPPVYGGARYDLVSLTELGRSQYAGIAFYDLPISLAADTALLPFLLAWHAWYQALQATDESNKRSAP